MSNEYKSTALAGTSKTTTGTTADAYAELTIVCQGYKDVVAFLTNTHATRSLDFKVDGYVSDAAREYALQTETALGATDTARILLPDGYYKFIISVKSTVAGTPATYALDYEMTGAR